MHSRSVLFFLFVRLCCIRFGNQILIDMAPNSAPIAILAFRSSRKRMACEDYTVNAVHHEIALHVALVRSNRENTMQTCSPNLEVDLNYME